MYNTVSKRVVSVVLIITLIFCCLTITYSADESSYPQVRKGLYSSDFASAASAHISDHWEEGGYFSSITLTLGSPLMIVDNEEIQITPLEMDGDMLCVELEDISDVIGFTVGMQRTTGNTVIYNDGDVTVISNKASIGNASIENTPNSDDENGGETLADDTQNEDAPQSESKNVAKATAGNTRSEDMPQFESKNIANATAGNTQSKDTPRPDGKDDFTNEQITRQWYNRHELEEALGISIEVENNAVHITSPFQLGQLIVQTRTGASLRDNYGATQSVSNGKGLYLLQYANGKAAETAYEAFSADGDVQYVTPNQIVRATSLGWGTDRIGANSYKEYLISNSKDTEVIVAVLDTGVDVGHPFFSGRTVSGYDFISNDNIPEDRHGHGTHVAGTITDCTPSNVKIMPVKVLGDDGYGSSFSISLGIDWAVANGAKVVNMSLGGYGVSYDEELAVNNAFDQGVVSVAAAGNDSRDTANFYPAAIPNVITVSASDRNGMIAYFSNYGAAIDVAAPGVDINSAIPGGRYGVKSGTSMAAPHVAAAVALFFTDNINLAPNDMKAAIRQATDGSGTDGWDMFYGTGILDLRSWLGADDEPYDMTLTLSNITASIPHQLGHTIPLRAIISPDYATNKSVTFTSSDPNVAVYENGGVVIKGEGTAVITGTTFNNISATCDVTVNNVSVTYDNWVYQDNVADDFASGSGTAASPYLIYTPQQLAKLARDIFYNDDLHTNDHFRLMQDIDLGGKEWTSIYYYDYDSGGNGGGFQFQGTFDGNNHVIKNLTISDETKTRLGLTDYWMVGLFGLIRNSTIKNLGVVDADISVSVGSSHYTSRIGILSGSANGNTISQCYTTGKTTGSGFVGDLTGSHSSSITSDCYSTADAVNSGFSFSLSGLEPSITRNSYASGNVTGNSSVGFTNSAVSQIVNSFYAGTASSGVGFAITKDSTAREIQKSYYLSTNPTGVATDQSSTEIDVTSKEMSFFLDKDSYTNQSNWNATYPWDFENVWDIHPEINNGLPYLKNSSYYKELGQVIAPKAAPDSGSVAAGTSVELSTDTPEATIYYTTDGEQPTQTSEIYQGPIIIGAPTTIKAYAVKPGMTDSDVSVFNYTIDAGVVSAPISDISSGEVLAGTEISLSTPTADAVIYYTTDGRTPSTSSFEYTEPIVLTKNTVIKAFAVKENLQDSAVSTFSYITFGQAVPAITVTTTGLNSLKVGKPVSGAGIVYRISQSLYEAAITTGDFTISGLPAGLTAGEAVRTNDTVVTIPITGTPTMHSASPVPLAYAASIPAANIQSTGNAVAPTGAITAGPVAKGDGAPVSGAPEEQNKTNTSITATAVINAGVTGQSVQYAISLADNADPGSLTWQSGTIFQGLAENMTYYIYARTEENANYNAGEPQVSAAIITASVVTHYTLTVKNGIDVTNSGPYTAGATVSIKADSAPAGTIFDRWTGDNGGIFGNINRPETTFIMPDNNATVTATFKKEKSGTGSSGESNNKLNYTTSPTLWIETPEAGTMARNSQDKQLNYARSRRDTITGIKKDSLLLLSESGLRYQHDTIAGNAVQVRVYIKEPGNATKDILVSGYVTGKDADRTLSRFGKYFPNKLAVVSMDQRGDFGMQVQIAARLDMSGMNTNNLYFYSYDIESNKYVRFQTEYRIDAKGYLHFATILAGNIIVSDGPLTKSGETQVSDTSEPPALVDLHNPVTGGDALFSVYSADKLELEKWDVSRPVGDSEALQHANLKQDATLKQDTRLKQDALNTPPTSPEIKMPSTAMTVAIMVALVFFAILAWALIPRKSDESVSTVEYRRKS